ncbi:hypothetical protein J2754_001595 [Halarchaeum solikamskense]|uniref:hypothetical protein n=1 Tax=Halarchaeum nitratireducens TaxID=489913 RepID=UPI001B3AF985|nr:hypothetical protein [Halarchaeum solikamskense]MBP2251274.1 hypothetical protein [Halarchaeum solikamskense]
MSESYGEYVRGRLAAGELACYSGGGMTVWMYVRNGAYYQYRVDDSPYNGIEREISPAKVERVVQRNYPVETAAADDAPNAVRARAEVGGDAVVAEWLLDARLLADRLRVGDAVREEASEMMSSGLQLADCVGDDTAEKVRERVRELGDARGD